MSFQNKFLITTADESTWKFDCPVIFLGEWCCLYSRKHIWQGMDSVIAKPYDPDTQKKKIDYLNLIKLEENLFPQICALLNNHHGTKHGKRFWNIAIGHWFRATLQMLYNRINTIEQLFKTENISKTVLYRSDYCSLASLDFSSTLISFNNDKWNNILYGRIIDLLGIKNIIIDFYDKEKNKFIYQTYKRKISSNNFNYKKKILKFIQEYYRKISERFVKNNDALIINSYLPKKEEIKLELALAQFPQSWIKEDLNILAKPDNIIRKNLIKNLIFKSNNKFENILSELLCELLPVCYLEGYKELNKIVEKQKWPKKPKFIFTSNSFMTDEVFKLWVANKVEFGTKYYVGQHGNNYFTRKNIDIRNRFPRVEEKTPDKFLTWGWSNGQSKFKPAFIFKTTGKKIYNHNSKGGLLLIEKCKSFRHEIWDSSSEFNDYFEDQKKFVKNLDNEVKKKLIIRLHPGYQDGRYNEDLKWQEFDKTLRINSEVTSIGNLTKKNRLTIFSYDSTALLETLSCNIPTLAFWKNTFEHLRESVLPDYQTLVDAGILHLSPESIANKVNEIWKDVDQWWKNDNIQKTRLNFCKKYAKLSNSPISDLKKILLS